MDRHRAVRRRALRLRAVRSVGAAAGDGVSRARLLRRRAGDRSRVLGRDVLQVPVSDRPVQLRRVDGVAARGAGAGHRNVPDVPDRRLHQGAARSAGAADRRAARLRAAAVPAVEGRQPRLHLLPGLRAGVPARQRGDRHSRAGRRTGRLAPALGDRPPRRAARHRGAGGDVRLRRPDERVRHDSADGRHRTVARARDRQRVGGAGCWRSCSSRSLGVAPLVLLGGAAASPGSHRQIADPPQRWT